jgi:hypothetical protein
MHGLTIMSELALQEPTCRRSAPDLKLILDAGSRTDSTPIELETLAELIIDDRLLYRASRSEEGTTVDFPGSCRFSIDDELRSVRCRPDPNADRRFVSVLAAGYLMAFLLALRGACVLHASAVVSQGRGLAVVGSAGMGKSSCAALLCAAGAELITDDVLRVEIDDDGASIVRGSSHLRLRPPAWSIVDLFEETPDTDETVDGRLAVFPARAAETAPLNAVIVPRRGSTDDVVVERLTEAEALWTLVRFPRIYGWRSEEVLRRGFLQLHELAQRIPVLTVQMPWGPPFHQGLGRRALAKIVNEL